VISVLQLFKIIFGVIISAFVLIIILNFALSYTNVGESSRDVEVLISLKKAIDDVYVTGIPTDFDINLEDVVGFYRPPNLVTSVSAVSLDPIPAFFVPGKEISIHRNEYDIGWWKFQFIEAVPEMKIIFVPLGTKEVVWKTAENITKYFPSTENTKTKVLFGVGCNDTGGKNVFFFLNWERDYLIKTVLPWLHEEGYEFDPCGRKEGYRMLTITETPVDADFQVVPIDGEMGYVYMNDTQHGQGTYLYKTPLDIIALFFGGEDMYEYENGKFLNDLSIASDLASREASLLRGKMNPSCDTPYSRFVQVLGHLKNIADNGDYRNEDDMRELNRNIRNSVEIYKEMEEMGC